jgi:hypothetical protein
MSGVRVSFPRFSLEQLNSIAGSTPAPCQEEALCQYREEYGEDAPPLFQRRAQQMCGAWETFRTSRTQKELEAFWVAQAKCEALVEGGLAGSALGLTPKEARESLMSEKARKGLRELEARERDLILQFRLR